MSGGNRLLEFDDFDEHVPARRTFEPAPVVTCLVRLDGGEPHDCVAPVAGRVFDVLRMRRGFGYLHGASPVRLQAGARLVSQSPAPGLGR